MQNQKSHLYRSAPPLLHLLLSLLLMSLSSLISSAAAAAGNRRRKPNKKHQPTLSWDHLRTLLNCKTAAAGNQVHDPSAAAGGAAGAAGVGKKLNLGVRAGDVVRGGARVVHTCDADKFNSSGGCGSQSTSYIAGETGRRWSPAAPARGGVQLMRLSGCYECRAVEAEAVSRRYPRPRTLCACPQCGEVFNKTDSLELHQTIRHAVSELGPDDSGRHIVEIIFKSSWQNNHRPICKIDRILKVHNTPRTISRFEDYRAAVKSLAAAAAGRRNPRCAADGNELLRFHAASLSCRLGAAAATSLCAGAGAAACGVCDVIRHGFRRPRHVLGVRTTASSGQAHRDFVCGDGAGAGARAMLVCRVIAGRVGYEGEWEDGEGMDGCDSVAAEGGNLEELYVGNPRAILPCFVVIYEVR